MNQQTFSKCKHQIKIELNPQQSSVKVVLWCEYHKKELRAKAFILPKEDQKYLAYILQLTYNNFH